MSNLTIKLDNQKLLQVRLVLSGVRDGYPKAVRWATNRAVSATKTAMSKEARAVLNLSKQRVDRDIVEKKMTANDMTAYVKRAGEPVGLINFAVKQNIAGQKIFKTNYKGVSVKVLKKTRAKILKGAFVEKGRGGTDKEHIFRRPKPPYKLNIEDMPENYRAYFAKRGRDKRRLPIERKTGPRVEDIISRSEVLKKIEARASEVFDKAIGDQTKYILSKL